MSSCCKVPCKSLGRLTKHVYAYDSTNGCLIERRSTSRVAFSTTSPQQGVPRKPSSPAKERQRAERGQLTRLLKESPGKRDARNFLKHFDTPKRSTEVLVQKAPLTDERRSDWDLSRTGVNLGSLYQPTIFTRDQLPEEKFQDEEGEEPLHLALVKLREPQSLDDQTLGGIALTLSQLARLGLATAVVLDCDTDIAVPGARVDPVWEAIAREQSARLVAALEDYSESGALLVENALRYTWSTHDVPSTAQARGQVEVENSFLLLPSIDDGIIPVISPVAYDPGLKKVRVQADDVVLALVREFSGIRERQLPGTVVHEQASGSLAVKQSMHRPILDRIIILDPLGGLPSSMRADGAHVFVNLQAEYQDIKQELQRSVREHPVDNQVERDWSFGSSNPFSKFVEDEVVSLPDKSILTLKSSIPTRHSKNLDLAERALRLLPPSSSALILTPAEAATKAIPDDTRTTPSKNPLLHNILTDKPMVSSSLPTSPLSHRLGSEEPKHATFLKKGVPLTIIPDPRITGPWRPPSASNPSIDLAADPRINFPKLEDLINDSFRRTLHPKDYLDRIRGRVAGIIITGDYEGGAICTWETPSSLLNMPIPERASSTPDSPYWIPYLDKFAVLTSSQGSGGVSDIVWAALVRSCFPEGVVWRSRTSNPVNKWYQERALGMWNLPGDQWTMFWTNEGVQRRWGEEWEGVSGARWDSYVDVCAGVVPSWADGIKRPD